MFLSTENRSGLKYSVKNSHHHLFVKLWALSQNSRFMEIAEFKQVRASLSTSGSDLRRMDLCKTVLMKKFTEEESSDIRTGIIILVIGNIIVETLKFLWKWLLG